MRRGLIASFALVLMVSITPVAQAVPPAAAGALASSNVDFVANIPDAPAIGGRILRGVDTLLGPKDLFYVTTSQGLRIYDVTLGIPVLTGALQLPHFENEDVDTNGKILLIAADHFLGFPNMLYVINVEVPQAPILVGVLPFPSEAHTVSCINDCKYAWLAGGSGLYVIDLTNPANPRQMSGVRIGQEYGGTHDVQVDEAGIAWVTGTRLTGYATGDTRTPASYGVGFGHNPVVVAKSDTSGSGAFNNNFILHNSMRPNALKMNPALLSNNEIDPGEAVYVTEEDYISLNEDGSFQAGYLRMVNGELKVDFTNRWTFADDFAVGVDHKVGVGFSSSHYFDYKQGVMAVAWYEQGTRFFDVSNPRILRPIGYFMPAAGNETWNAVFNGEYVYTIDVGRGIDVLKFNGSTSSATVELPNVPRAALSTQNPKYAACRILVA